MLESNYAVYHLNIASIYINVVLKKQKANIEFLINTCVLYFNKGSTKVKHFG